MVDRNCFTLKVVDHNCSMEDSIIQITGANGEGEGGQMITPTKKMKENPPSNIRKITDAISRLLEQNLDIAKAQSKSIIDSGSLGEGGRDIYTLGWSPSL